MAQKRSRLWISTGLSLLVLAALLWAFWPRPLLVDIETVQYGELVQTIDDEGKTRVRDTFVVSTPVTGRLLRVTAEPGDVVEAQQSLATMLPIHPTALDIRSREQALAAIAESEAAVRMARAELNKAMADKEFSDAELQRIQRLKKSGSISQSALDEAQHQWRAANAALEVAEAAISARQAGLVSARAQLLSGQDDQRVLASNSSPSASITSITAPISGQILRVLQESETTLPAGTPILELGDTSNDLEVVTDLLSTDAVKVSVGNRVMINNWGGIEPLYGRVIRVDPWGYTKFSALGVEEQRVNVIIELEDAPEKRFGLGHGFRVESQIVIWENPNALLVPASALFRLQNRWAVFVVTANKAKLTEVRVGRNNGVNAEVKEGLAEGDRVILYPSSELNDGSRVKPRALY